MSEFKNTIFYDDRCKLCRSAVDAVRRGDREGDIQYLPLSSTQATELLPLSRQASDTLYFIDDDGRHDRSSAVIRIASHLDPPWSFMKYLRIIPRPLRDAAYDFVARHRRRWFGTID